MTEPQPSTTDPTGTRGPAPIDARGPRFGAGVTFVLAIAALFLGLVRPLEESALLRIGSPEFILLGVVWLAFAIGTFVGLGASPWALLFKHLIRPRLRPGPTEDPRPPHFALGIGFALSTAGLVLHVVGVPYGLIVASAAIVIASFLNAFVGYCLGCQVFLLLVRAGVIRPRTPIQA